MTKRIETTTSRTAEMTCISRAASSLERDGCYKSGDYLAPVLLPDFFRLLFRVSPVRKLFIRSVAPQGMYEYVIARTRYIDAAFQQAFAEHFEQVLIFGAGFDTRALRFQAEAQAVHLFELDAPVTQAAKIGQYQKRGLAIPPNLTFIAIDFDKETLPEKLDEAGFCKGRRSLFLLEGLLMYLQPASVRDTFRTIQDYAGSGSRVVFDYVYASVLRKEGLYDGEKQIVRTVEKAGEGWQFGIEKGQVGEFLAEFGFTLLDQKDAPALERAYFSGPGGRIVGKVNGTHCLVTAEKK